MVFPHEIEVLGIIEIGARVRKVRLTRLKVKETLVNINHRCPEWPRQATLTVLEGSIR